jgi:hypothetical protein
METHRDWLWPHEVAAVLQRPVADVRNMVRRGALTDVRPGRLRGISAHQVRELLADQPLALAVLEAIVEGRLCVERLDATARPPSLIESWDRVS